MIRSEFECEIPYQEGLFMYQKCENTLEKIRRSVDIGNEHYDVDTYPNGLVVVEIEYKTIEESLIRPSPAWVGKEVSSVKKFSNIMISKQNLKFKW